ncbi:MAG: hypothetical protein FD123_2047 [Bacteroidetes bacterium]|nr:MAG: hypothetical protein FD123_2047 [Bacteroidota bacterium]
MARKPTRKEKLAQQKQQQQTAAPAEAKPQPQQQRKKNKTAPQKSKLLRGLGILVFAFAFIIYANTLGHEYALDDYGVILENQVTKSGFDGIGTILKTGYRTSLTSVDYELYRPLSKVMFAIEWGMSPNSPGLSHFMNVVLFALSGLFLFRTLCLYLPQSPLVPFIAAIIFVAHPIHTEVVANIKGRDDILCFLFFIGTAFYVHRYTVSRSNKHLMLAAVSFFLSFLSKESAITFLAVIPLMLYFFTDAPKKIYVSSLVALGITTGIFLLIRHSILSGGYQPVPAIDNYLAGIRDFVTQKTTAVFLMGVYLKQLVVPYPLISDGSIKHFDVAGLGDWQFWVSMLIYAGLAVVAFRKFRAKNIYAFCILYFFVTASIISNIPFILGTNYGERLLFAPSLAICIAAAAAIAHFLQKTELPSADTAVDFLKKTMKPMAAAAVIALVFGTMTAMRNPDWHDNRTLYTNDLEKAPNSAKLHYYFGNHITQEENLAKLSPEAKKLTYDTAISEFRKSLACYPFYTDPTQKLGQSFMEIGKLDSSEFYYKKALKLLPGSPTFHNNYGRMLFSAGRVEDAKKEFEQAIKFNPNYAHAENNLASALGTIASGKFSQSLKDSLNRQALQTEARTLFETSLTHSLRAIAIDPGYVQAYQTTAITYGSLGDKSNQEKYNALAQQARQQTGQ